MLCLLVNVSLYTGVASFVHYFTIMHLMLELLSFVTWAHTFERFTTTDCTQTHIAHVHGNHTHVARTTSTSLSEGKCQAAAFNSSLTLKYTETKQHKYRLQYRLSWSFPVVRYWPNYVPVQNITVSQYPSLVKTNLKVSDSPLQLKKYDIVQAYGTNFGALAYCILRSVF